MDKAVASTVASRACAPLGAEVVMLQTDHIEEHRLHVANEWRAAPRALRKVYSSFAPGLYRVVVATVTARGQKDRTLFHGVTQFSAVDLDTPPAAAPRPGPRPHSEPASPALPAPSAPAPAFLRSHHLVAHRATHLTKSQIFTASTLLDPERAAALAIEITLLPDSALSVPSGSVLKFTSQAAAVPTPLVALVDDAGVLIAHSATPVTTTPTTSSRFRPTPLHKRLYEQKLDPTPFLPQPEDPIDEVQQERNEVARKRKMYRAEPYEVPSETETLTYSRTMPAPFARKEPPGSPPRTFGAAVERNEQRRRIAALDWHVVVLYSALAGLFLWEFFYAARHLFASAAAPTTP